MALFLSASNFKKKKKSYKNDNWFSLFRSWEWKPGSNENCFNESYPIQGPYWGTGSNLEIMQIIHDALRLLKIDVTLLNITQLSEYRKDAHTSVYGERKGKLLTKKQRANPKDFADCIHWCLPGVPDAWNEILYAYLLKGYQNFSWNGQKTMTWHKLIVFHQLIIVGLIANFIAQFSLFYKFYHPNFIVANFTTLSFQFLYILLLMKDGWLTFYIGFNRNQCRKSIFYIDYTYNQCTKT